MTLLEVDAEEKLIIYNLNGSQCMDCLPEDKEYPLLRGEAVLSLV